jgi:hypothetical protein
LDYECQEECRAHTTFESRRIRKIFEGTEQAKRFREAFSPSILQMEFRLAELENPVRQNGIKLGDVAEQKASVNELQRASLVMRAQSYRRRLFGEFDRGFDFVSPVQGHFPC